MSDNENIDWIIRGIRESLEMIREAKDSNSEWEVVPENDEVWE